MTTMPTMPTMMTVASTINGAGQAVKREATGTSLHTSHMERSFTDVKGMLGGVRANGLNAAGTSGARALDDHLDGLRIYSQYCEGVNSRDTVQNNVPHVYTGGMDTSKNSATVCAPHRNESQAPTAAVKSGAMLRQIQRAKKAPCVAYPKKTEGGKTEKSARGTTRLLTVEPENLSRLRFLSLRRNDSSAPSTQLRSRLNELRARVNSAQPASSSLTQESVPTIVSKVGGLRSVSIPTLSRPVEFQPPVNVSFARREGQEVALKAPPRYVDNSLCPLLDPMYLNRDPPPLGGYVSSAPKEPNKPLQGPRVLKSPLPAQRNPAKVHVVFDTSSLLHAGESLLDQVLKYSVVCIPFDVIAELDGLNCQKGNRDPGTTNKKEPRVGFKARQIRNWIISSMEKNGSNIRIQRRREVERLYDLTVATKDDSILGFAVFLEQKEHVPVEFVTDDKFLRVKAVSELKGNVRSLSEFVEKPPWRTRADNK